MTTILFSSISLDNRFRKKYKGIPELAQEISELGLIQPLILARNADGTHRLVAGGRRTAALKLLNTTDLYHGHTSQKGKPGFVYMEEVDEDTLLELELKENFNRENFTWQEECLAVAEIHRRKTIKNALDSKSWGQRETGRFLNINQAKVAYCLIVAKELVLDDKQENAFWKAETFTDAYNIIMQRQLDEANKLLATAQSPQQFNAVDAFSIDHTKDNPFYVPEIKDLDAACTVCDGKSTTCPSCKGTGYARNQPVVEKPHTIIPISRQYIWADSITFMNTNAACFDHIITDIPFGIDIEMIDQMDRIKNIDTIKAEHTVEGNEALHAQFFPAAYNTLKDNAFLITWCDIMQWQRMYDLAVAAGFKVQRWPFIWDKTYPCLNQMAQYNFTKSFEIAMVCRKGNITLVNKQPTCIVHTGKDSLCEGHPFAKPFAVWQPLIDAVSIKNQTILDPFCGSGSMMKSGIRMERQITGIEKDEQLFYNGLESMKQFYLSLDSTAIFS